MLTFQWQAVEIDRCPACCGLWLDAGELATLLMAAGLPHGPLSAALEGGTPGPRTRRRCPRCPRRLYGLHLGGAPELVLDRCRRGHGLWFDAGEVDQLLRSFSTGEEGAIARFVADLFHDGAPAPGR